MKIKLPTAHTGMWGSVEFVDGVSTHIVSPKTVNMFKGNISGVEILQDDGVTVDEALNSMFPIVPLGHYIEMGIEPPSVYLTDWLGQYPEGYGPNAEQPKEEKPAEASTEVETEERPATPEGSKVKYTAEQLEKIADEQGIAGLRAIAEPLGIKARSIAELIKELSAQGYVE